MESDGSWDAVGWLDSLNINGIKLGLRNVTELLRRLGDPQDSFESVHVAGSDGKGSTCAIVESVLRASGLRTGLYTSPHLLRFSERIRVDGEEIPDADLQRVGRRVRDVVDAMRPDGFACTYFECATAMAFLYFREKGVQVAVVEVGMGGRFDATNVIRPLVSAISNISLEHTRYLGDTIEKIAFEKAGIIKEGVPCVTLNPEPALGVIREVAKERRSPLTEIPAGGPEVLRSGPDGPTFRYRGEDYRVSIPGRFEARDAVLAIEALRALPFYREKVESHLREGLESVRWPCRLEPVGSQLIIDVTHTEAGSEGLARDVAEIYGKLPVVFGVLEDKDVDGICRNIAGVASRVVVCAPETERARPAASTLEHMLRFFPDAEVAGSVGEAVSLAVSGLHEGERALVTGSFHMAEEALIWLAKRESS